MRQFKCFREGLSKKEQIDVQNGIIKRNRIRLDEDPDIGWWRDQSELILYHGTHKKHIDSIYENGLNRRDPDTNMISLALDPYTAKAYASMSGAGGEAAFRRGGVAETPEDEKVVFVFKIPMKWVLEHYDKKLGGNVGETFDRMNDENIYINWKGGDRQYYEYTELRFDDVVPPDFITGYVLFEQAK